MILRLLNWQGIAGVALSIALLTLVIAERIQTHHWHSQSDRFEKLYADLQLAFAQTTASYREAADTARAEDRANVARVVAEQRTINERTDDDFQKRIAAARAAAIAAATRLQSHSEAAADPGDRRAASVPRLPAAARGSDQATRQDGLPTGDALTATEQAIQLDELIAWVKRQAAVDPSNNIATETVHP